MQPKTFFQRDSPPALPSTSRSALLITTLPVFLTGFLASAVANRLAFLGWAVVTAVFHAVVLYKGVVGRWSTRRIIGALLLATAGGLAALGAMADHFRDALALGLRAYSVFDPLLIEPRTFLLPAAGLLLTAVVLLLPRRAR